MFTNYIKIAFRQFLKFKGISIINIAGLAVGMAVCLLTVLWVIDELSFDRFHDNADRIFRVIDYEKYTNGSDLTFASNPPALSPLLKSQFPEIIESARILILRDMIVKYEDKLFTESGILCADSGFFNIFTYPLAIGSPESALNDIHSIIVSEEMAVKYFAEDNPIGKTLRVNNKVDFIVSGVMKNVPANAHLQFDFITSFLAAGEFGHPMEGWNSFRYPTYVLLYENADPAMVSEKIANVVNDNVESIATLSLQPVPDIHLYSQHIWGIGGTGDIKYVYIFSIIAGFILLLACINYMNLATARFSSRAKEIGLRKVVGASRNKIIKQFYGESLMITSFSLIISLILLELLLPTFNTIAGKEIEISFANNSIIYIILLITAIVAGIISGSYPALFLSAFQPVKVLKGNLRSGTKSPFLRKLLVSMQFIITVALLTGTMIVNRQMHYIRNQKLGFDKEHVLCVKLKGDLNQKIDILKNELASNDNIINISATQDLPISVRTSTLLSEWEGRDNDDQFLIHIMSADGSFPEIMNLEMIQGRFFANEFYSADTAGSIVINETAYKLLNMKEPIGKKIMWGNLIGIIKDYNFKSLHSAITPLAFYFDPNQFKHLLIKISPKDVDGSIKSLEKSWNKVFPDYPFEFNFLDEEIDRQYKADSRTGQIINTFTILALFIACLGLLGLASFAADQRTSEIGIRKVLGASVANILSLMSKEILLLITLANIIAWPLSYYFMNKWLVGFEYRISFNDYFWLFPFAAVVTVIIAILTVSYQSVRAALTDPVKSLKYE